MKNNHVNYTVVIMIVQFLFSFFYSFTGTNVELHTRSACNSVTEEWMDVRYTWPITEADTTLAVQQPCPFNEEYFAYKRCIPGDERNPARYGPTNYTACTSVDRALDDLLKGKVLVL